MIRRQPCRSGHSTAISLFALEARERTHSGLGTELNCLELMRELAHLDSERDAGSNLSTDTGTMSVVYPALKYLVRLLLSPGALAANPQTARATASGAFYFYSAFTSAAVSQMCNLSGLQRHRPDCEGKIVPLVWGNSALIPPSGEALGIVQIGVLPRGWLRCLCARSSSLHCYR